MRHDSKFSNWIRAAGQSAFVLNLNSLHDLKAKFSVVPERLLDGIIDDARVIATQRLNIYLPKGVSIDIQSVDLSDIRDRLRSEVANRLSEIGVAVDQNDPKIAAIIARYAEVLNGFFQTQGLQLENDVWRSRDDARVRSAHAQNDDQVFFWSDTPEGGHPGQGWNCRCTADAGLTNAATDAITARINLRTETYEDRQGHMRRFRDGGEFDEICRFSVARPRFEDSE